MKFPKIKGALVGGLVACGAGGFLIYSSLYSVNAGHRALIYSRLKGLKPEVIAEGTHFCIPWLERPYIFDVTTKPRQIGSECGTNDLQVVKIQLRVLSRPQVQKLPEIYRDLGKDYDERIIPSIVHEQMKQVIAKYNASMLLTNRDQVTQEIRESITRRARDFHIDVEDVSIMAQTFSQEFTTAVEKKQVAQQEAERARYIVVKAQQEKKQMIIRAEGEAKSAELVGLPTKNRSEYIELRRLDAAREIATLVAQSNNRVYLNADSLLLNLLSQPMKSGDDNWEQRIDSSSNQPYFYNPKTKERRYQSVGSLHHSHENQSSFQEYQKSSLNDYSLGSMDGPDNSDSSGYEMRYKPGQTLPRSNTTNSTTFRRSSSYDKLHPDGSNVENRYTSSMHPSKSGVFEKSQLNLKHGVSLNMRGKPHTPETDEVIYNQNNAPKRKDLMSNPIQNLTLREKENIQEREKPQLLPPQDDDNDRIPPPLNLPSDLLPPELQVNVKKREGIPDELTDTHIEERRKSKDSDNNSSNNSNKSPLEENNNDIILNDDENVLNRRRVRSSSPPPPINPSSSSSSTAATIKKVEVEKLLPEMKEEDEEEAEDGNPFTPTKEEEIEGKSEENSGNDDINEKPKEKEKEDKHQHKHKHKDSEEKIEEEKKDKHKHRHKESEDKGDNRNEEENKKEKHKHKHKENDEDKKEKHSHKHRESVDNNEENKSEEDKKEKHKHKHRESVDKGEESKSEEEKKDKHKHKHDEDKKEKHNHKHKHKESENEGMKESVSSIDPVPLPPQLTQGSSNEDNDILKDPLKSSSNDQLEPLQRSQLPPYRQSPLHNSIKPNESMDEDELDDDDIKPLPRASLDNGAGGGIGDLNLDSNAYIVHRNDVGRFRSGSANAASSSGSGSGGLVNTVNPTNTSQRLRSISQSHPSMLDDFNANQSRDYGWSQDTSEEGDRRQTGSIDYRGSDTYDFVDEIGNRTMSESQLGELDHRDSDETRDVEITKYAYIRTEAEKVIKCILDQQKKINTKKNYVNYPESYLVDYAQTNYILSRIGIFRSTATIDKVLSWKSTCIKQPLLKVNSFSLRLCTRLFKNILFYSGDIDSKLSCDEIVSRTISECLKNDTKITDELYCQLCKQTYNNCSKKENSLCRTWAMFSIICGSLCPSDELKPYIFTYICDTIASANNEDVKKYAEDCKDRFSRTATLSYNRLDIPTNIEYSAVRNHSKLIIRVFLLNNTSYLINIDSFTTIKELKETMNNILKIRPQFKVGYSIFQTDDFINFVSVNNDDRVVSILSEWCDTYHSIEMEKAKDPGYNRVNPIKYLVFKVNAYLDIQFEGNALDLLYTQCKHDITYSIKPFSKNDLLSLASLALRVKYLSEVNDGDITEGKYIRDKSIIEEFLKNFLPASVEFETDDISRVASLFESLNFNIFDTKRGFIEYAEKSPYFGFTVFPVRPLNRLDLPRDCYLALSPTSVTICDQTSKDILKSYSLNEIIRYGYTEDIFTIDVGTLVSNDQLSFKIEKNEYGVMTHKPIHISDMLETYLMLSMQRKQITDMSTV